MHRNEEWLFKLRHAVNNCSNEQPLETTEDQEAAEATLSVQNHN